MWIILILVMLSGCAKKMIEDVVDDEAKLVKDVIEDVMEPR